MTADRQISNGFHWSFGWQRRFALDTAEGFCYEHPDGSLIFSRDPRHRICAHLTHWHDAETGESYSAFSAHPVATPSAVRWLRHAR